MRRAWLANLWKTLVTAAACAVLCPFGISPVVAGPLLETSRSCSGTRLGQPQRLEIVGWDGDSREAHRKRVYRFRVKCDGRERDIVDLFVNAERSDRYKREGNTLLWRSRMEWRSVTTREAGCRQVPKQVRTYPSDAEARTACRGQANPYACMLEVQGQDRWVTQMVEECWRARYDRRQVPVWERFPAGYAPLPRGARIVQAAQVAGWRQQDSGSRGAVNSEGGPSSFFMLLVMALLAGGAFYYFRRRDRDALREKVAAARSQMGGGGGNDFGVRFDTGGFGSSGEHSQTGADRSEAHAYARKNFDACNELRHRVGDLCDRVETLATNLGRDDLVKEARTARQTISSSDMKAWLDRAEWGLYQTNAQKIVDILEGYLREMRAAGANQRAQSESDRHGEPPRAKSADDLPETLEEACDLLNVTPDTPREEVSKVYTAMARVWHPDKATGDADRSKREAKMKQLNAAKELLLKR